MSLNSNFAGTSVNTWSVAAAFSILQNGKQALQTVFNYRVKIEKYAIYKYNLTTKFK